MTADADVPRRARRRSSGGRLWQRAGLLVAAAAVVAATAPEPLAAAPGAGTPRGGSRTGSAAGRPATAPPASAAVIPKGPPPVPGTFELPFAAASPWNIPVPSNPVLQADSAAIVASLLRWRRPAVAQIYADSTGVFRADASTPSYHVTCSEPWGTCPLAEQPVPIPAGARPSSGSDHAMVVVDSSTNRSYEFWEARQTGAGWRAAWGAVEDTAGSGIHGVDGQPGGTGSGDSALAGLVRLADMARGEIRHALVFASSLTCARVFRYPALKTDGTTDGPCIPEGARIQLDPTVDVGAIPGISQGELAVARALQVYGGYCRDTGGSALGFVFEDPMDRPNPFPAAGFPTDYWNMPHIPWNAIRVLARWDGS